MTAPDLAYVALVVDEPDTCAVIFEKDFGLPRIVIRFRMLQAISASAPLRPRTFWTSSVATATL
jgi:hypothetical protein